MQHQFSDFDGKCTQCGTTREAVDDNLISAECFPVRTIMLNADDRRIAEPWHPMTSPIDLKTLGKLQEELGELMSAISRCMIQGIFECEPVTGKSNHEWLCEEIADVRANMVLVIERWQLSIDQDRILRKIAQLKQWHAMA